MAPSTLPRRPALGIERVREHLLTSLHLGRLTPGDRVVSVRRLADITGMNRKTVHRAYRELAREGFLEARPGAGTYIADPATPGAGERELLRAANRCRAEAAATGMPPAVFAEFVANYLGGGLRDLPVAVVECNLEQCGLIAEDLRLAFGVHTRSVLLEHLRRNPASVRGLAAIVTTDCHRTEVAEYAAPTGLPVYRVALDATFPQAVLRRLERGALVMVVRDSGFAPVFRRLLVQLGADEERLSRLAIVDPEGAREAWLDAGKDAMVCVSPLVVDRVARRLPPSAPRFDGRWRVPHGALDRVRVALARDRALARAGVDGAGVRRTP